MNPEQIAEKTQKLRADYPAMFSHPDLKEGEVQIGDIIADAASAQVHMYKNAGLRSARLGPSHLEEANLEVVTDTKPKPITAKLSFYPIFVNLEEYLALEEKSEQKKATHPAPPK